MCVRECVIVSTLPRCWSSEHTLTHMHTHTLTHSHARAVLHLHDCCWTKPTFHVDWKGSRVFFFCWGVGGWMNVHVHTTDPSLTTFNSQLLHTSCTRSYFGGRSAPVHPCSPCSPCSRFLAADSDVHLTDFYQLIFAFARMQIC